jgi:hypothetical protein
MPSKIGKISYDSSSIPHPPNLLYGPGGGGQMPPTLFRKCIFLDFNEIKGFFSDFRIIRRKTAKFSLNSGISELFSKT